MERLISSDCLHFTSRWKNRAHVETPIRILSDPNLEWMTMYSAVVENEHWSLSVYVIDTDAIIQKLERKVDPSKASKFVMDAVESMQ